ncbi:MAG: type II toxin-antitoxin system VapC family toxin [Nocardioides sp.]
MILLDTHVALWLMAAPDRIGPEARARITDAPRVFFSAVTVVETSIKRMIGRLDVPADLGQVLRDQGLTPLPLTDEHAVALERFPELARHDPFDRLLLAQALVERCQLLTGDDRLLTLGHSWVIDAQT